MFLPIPAEKYNDLLRKEDGIRILESVFLQPHSTIDVKRLATTLIKRVEDWCVEHGTDLYGMEQSPGRDKVQQSGYRDRFVDDDDDCVDDDDDDVVDGEGDDD